ncbi:LPS export ABC transporter permease LptG [Paracandidimonas soli]|uniref:Lipopolysaccharide export system permease protein n=1 Tax=Paracandidimonas soli TaxID=1917182 RepID=A0A4V6P2V2_9BURK|nr:LPS export ABC transporter permease LptG [Paracandidimonas soli]TCV03070.1 lipopolysaccharide export system permease protein [Paracandidimonas soli]
MRTARRYLAKEIYRSSAIVLIALLGLFTFFTLIEELDNVGSQLSLLNLLYLQLLSLPTRLYELLPIGMLIGTILALAGLAQRHELVILRVSGVSGIRLLLTLWVITIPMMLFAYVLSEVVTPAAELRASEASLQLLGRAGGGRLNSGYWFKENDGNGNTRIINISSLQSSGGVSGITLYEFGEGQEMHSFSTARQGRFTDGKLILEEVAETRITIRPGSDLSQARSPDEPLTKLHSMPQRSLNTTLTPERLIARVLNPELMAIPDLLDYIGYLKSNHLQTDLQMVALWRKIAYPFTLLVMMTIAAPISFMQTRRGGVGSKVFIGILLGVGSFMLNQLALNIGMLGKWAPWFTALAPSLGALALALTALLLMENQHRVRRFLLSHAVWQRSGT